jgi:hypothetical protein
MTIAEQIRELCIHEEVPFHPNMEGIVRKIQSRKDDEAPYSSLYLCEDGSGIVVTSMGSNEFWTHNPEEMRSWMQHLGAE